MGPKTDGRITRGQWLALTAALLGWLFDGFEMGLFPMVARPSLQELLTASGGVIDDKTVGFWLALTNASFLIGAATGGVVFGWLGDRLGRVRAMTLSILTYALCSGMGGLTAAPWQMVVVRFLAALGMGGEWSLGVALVMEVWGGRSRAMLAGLIGAAANVGYMLVGVFGLGIDAMRSSLADLGLREGWLGWRLLMLCGALPALLTFFVRLFVPESERWQREKERGATSAWATRDLLMVLVGVGICAALLAVWDSIDMLALRLGMALVALVLVAGCYLYPIAGYLRRANEPAPVRSMILKRMLLGAMLSGVALLATWGAVQLAPTWAHQLGDKAVKAGQAAPEEVRNWKEHTQIALALGAIAGCIGGALLAGWIGRRIAYAFLCAGSLGTVLWLYQGNTTFNGHFLLTAFLAGGFSAAFYGWLPLYLPELFPTRVRATGQGFGFNFGRIIAAIGVLQLPALMGKPEEADYARAGSLLAMIYILGMLVIWIAPETKGKPLPD
jgi:MFS transporter, SHS family, sialic acid transporter